MRVGILMTGVVGRIAWSYAIAADVSGYVIERDPHGVVRLRCNVTNADEYKLRQSPLTFIITLKNGEWSWPILGVDSYTDHALAARLGEPTTAAVRAPEVTHV